MILVDTSIWVDHLRVGDAALARLLDAGQVLTHPFVIGEIALGTLSQRPLILSTLADLPAAKAASDAEVLHFIEERRLFGRGIGYVDSHLLAATRLTTGARLWTKDRMLREAAADLDLLATP